MPLDEKLQQYAKKLPHSFQEDLLDFVAYLTMKAAQQEKQEWPSFSFFGNTRYGRGAKRIQSV